MMPTIREIFSKSRDLKNRIFAMKQELEDAENELEQLQKSCPHPNKETHIGYDFTVFRCDICRADWVER